MSAGLPQHLTLDYLRSLLSRGVEHAPVTEEARKVLRQWVIEARRVARGDTPASASARFRNGTSPSCRHSGELPTRFRG